MSSVLALARRELSSAFVSPIAYTTMIVFLVICGWGFAWAVGSFAQLPPMVVERTGASMRTFLIGGPRGLSTWVTVAVLLALPGLSMRVFSEERKGGTIELLLTSPLTTPQLVLGKYLGIVAIYALMLLLTLPYVWLMSVKGDPEWGALGTAYLGFFLYGSVLLAMGVFASSLTENQIVAVVLTYAFFLPFFLLELVVGMLGEPWDEIAYSLSVGIGRRDLARGYLDSHFLVLYGALIFAFLFLSTRVIDSNRWR